jgi:hypothetical protein
MLYYLFTYLSEKELQHTGKRGVSIHHVQDGYGSNYVVDCYHCLRPPVN